MKGICDLNYYLLALRYKYIKFTPLTMLNEPCRDKLLILVFCSIIFILLQYNSDIKNVLKVLI